MGSVRSQRLAALAAGAVLILAAWSIFSLPEDPATRNVAAVRRANLEVRVDAVGSLDAARGHPVTATLRGDRGKIVQIAEDGARVAKGDVVVRFDAAPLETEVHRLSGELRSREAVAAYARQSLEVEKAQVERALAHAEAELRAARQELARHQAYIDDLEALARRGLSVASEVTQARRKLDQVATLARKSESDFERGQREAVHRLAQSMAEVNKTTAEAQTTRQALELARAELGKTVVRAPIPGFVVLHELPLGEQKRRVRIGDTVWQGQPILYLPDLSSMVVRSRVREEDLHKIRDGLPASVRVDAYPDAVLRGRVAGVGALALESASTGASGKHFQLTVAIDDPDPRLRPGMTARVEIVADSARGALVIPIPALFHQNGQPVCYVVDGGSIAPRAVVVGRRGDDLLEITSGLAEGERVSLVRP